MAIRRYTSIADTTITNAYKASMTARGTDANMGQSDILEVFSIYAQADETSSEQARILINFPIDEIVADITADKVPSSNVKYYLKLFLRSRFFLNATFISIYFLSISCNLTYRVKF